MIYIPTLLVKHGLDQHADERAIKRAYAKDLKQIDQAESPAQFQQLREDYEAALAWLVHRDAGIIFQMDALFNSDAVPIQSNDDVVEIDPKTIHFDEEPSQTHDAHFLHSKAEPKIVLIDEQPDLTFQNNSKNDAKPSPFIMVPDEQKSAENEPITNDKSPPFEKIETPQQVANAIFDELLSQIRAHGEMPNKAFEALQNALLDARLIQIDVQNWFELAVANYLMTGWQEGNGELLEAAITLFKWDNDKKHLLSMGQVGIAIDAALIESTYLHQQTAEEVDKQQKIIQALRKNERPSDEYLQKYSPLLKNMLANCPNWMALLVSKPRVLQWLEWEKSVYSEQRSLVESNYKKSSNFSLGDVLSPVILITFAIIASAVSYFTSPPISHNVSRPSSSEIKPNSTHSSQESNPNAAKRPEASLTPEQLDSRGDDYFYGRNGFTRNLNSAMQYWVMAADKNYANAQYRLGYLYREGKILPTDDKQSFEWMKMAAENGHVAAQMVVGAQYEEGRGVARNLIEARRWYLRAAIKGNLLAKNNVAQLYRLEKDCNNAKKWFESAIESGIASAKANLGEMIANGECGLPVDKPKALIMIYQAAAADDRKAAYLLGTFYELGFDNVKIDLDYAVYWYAIAARQNDANALAKLRHLCNRQNYQNCPKNLDAPINSKPITMVQAVH